MPTAAPHSFEEIVVDLTWRPVLSHAVAATLSKQQTAARLEQLQRRRAMDAAEEAELILRLAGLCPDDEDLVPGAPGARRGWTPHEEEGGVSEFFFDELGHALNVSRGAAAFRAKRAFTWHDQLPGTFALLKRGELDERRAGLLAEVLQYTDPALAQAVEARLLPEAVHLSLARLKRRALELLLELDAAAADERHEQAKRAADVFVEPRGDGMATIGADLPVEQAAQIYGLINELATMAEADGDPRPIRRLRTEVFWQLLARPGATALPGVHTTLTIHAALATLEGASTQPGDVAGFAVAPTQLRDLLTRVGALGLTACEGGEVLFALADEFGRLLATVTLAELQRRIRHGEGIDPPPPVDRYQPTPAQHRLVAVRDRTCRMPNRGQRVGWADHDHVLAHAAGGQTTCSNLCCLCRHHHRLKTHARDWTFVMQPDGTLHATSPAGITRTTRPPGLRPPAPEPPPDPDDPPF